MSLLPDSASVGLLFTHGGAAAAGSTASSEAPAPRGTMRVCATRGTFRFGPCAASSRMPAAVGTWRPHGDPCVLLPVVEEGLPFQVCNANIFPWSAGWGDAPETEAPVTATCITAPMREGKTLYLRGV